MQFQHDLVIGIAEFHRDPGRDDAEVSDSSSDGARLSGHGVSAHHAPSSVSWTMPATTASNRFIADTLTENRADVSTSSRAPGLWPGQYSADAEVGADRLETSRVPGGALAGWSTGTTWRYIESLRRLLAPAPSLSSERAAERRTIGHGEAPADLVRRRL